MVTWTGFAGLCLDQLRDFHRYCHLYSFSYWAENHKNMENFLSVIECKLMKVITIDEYNSLAVKVTF